MRVPLLRAAAVAATRAEPQAGAISIVARFALQKLRVLTREGEKRGRDELLRHLQVADLRRENRSAEQAKARRMTGE
eukprot:SAG11_NODE_1215_length_5501_cov_4.190820_4_plen_77_part_00